MPTLNENKGKIIPVESPIKSVKKLEKLIPWINPKNSANAYFTYNFADFTLNLSDIRLKAPLIRIVIGINSSIK